MTSSTFTLNQIVQMPMAVAVSEEDDTFYVASNTGLHEFKLITKRLVKTIKFGIFMDVLFIELPSDFVSKHNLQSNKALAASYLFSVERKGPNARTSILIYSYPNPNLNNAWEPIVEIYAAENWGRICKLAYSKKQVCCILKRLFASCVLF